MKKLIAALPLSVLVCLFCLLIPSTAFASSGGGPQAVNVQHVQVALHPQPLSAAQLATLSTNMSKRAPRATAAVAGCIARPNDTNCSGKDPINESCTSSEYVVAESAFTTTVGSNSLIMGLADLKYSNACFSNWTKGYSGNVYNLGANGTWTFTLDELDIVRADGLHEPYFPEAEYGNAAYTDMVYAPVQKAKACVSFFYTVAYPNGKTSGGSTSLFCTAFF